MGTFNLSWIQDLQHFMKVGKQQVPQFINLPSKVIREQVYAIKKKNALRSHLAMDND